MTELSDAQILSGAVELAFHRVVGIDPGEKLRRREYLHDLMSALRLGYVHEKRPTAGEIKAAIGDTDDKAVLAALDRWEANTQPL